MTPTKPTRETNTTSITNRPTSDPDERAVLVVVERKLKQGCTKEQVARWLQELANYLLMESGKAKE